MRAGTIGLTLIIALVAAGCGQTGPLYLPDDDSGQQQRSESE